MPTIFTSDNNGSTLGRAASLDLEKSSLAFINFVTFNKEFQKDPNPIALIQMVTLDQKTNHQFNLSLRQVIYLYVFGNLMGDITVTGALFSGNCSSSASQDKNGFDEILNFYTKNRLSSNSELVEISVGTKSMKGFLIGLNLQPTDQTTLLTPFVMFLRVLPESDKKTQEVASSSNTGGVTSGSSGSSGSFLTNQLG